MVNELCKLAPSGTSVSQMVIIGFAIFSASLMLFAVLKKYKISTKWMLMSLVFVFSLTLTTSRQTVFAQSAEDCTPSQVNNGSGDSGGSSALGNLNNDNPLLSYDSMNSVYSASFSVLPNDTAPNGDAFDVSTLRLLGDYQDPGDEYSFLILDPSNPIPPTTPNSPMNPDWANVWGRWILDLSCNPADVAHCDTDPGGNATCSDPSAGTCWPNGNVYVELWDNAQSGTYSIPYTVNTVSGKTFTPANITVNLNLVFSTINALSGTYAIDSDANNCESWPTVDFSLDIMDYVLVNPGSTADLSAIDLDPSTPGVDSSVTIYNPDDAGDYITLSVDSVGIVTMTAPMGGTPGFSNNYDFDFTIKDTDQNISNTATITLQFSCPPPT